jgi:hypothetical protein
MDSMVRMKMAKTLPARPHFPITARSASQPGVNGQSTVSSEVVTVQGLWSVSIVRCVNILLRQSKSGQNPNFSGTGAKVLSCMPQCVAHTTLMAEIAI